MLVFSRTGLEYSMKISSKTLFKTKPAELVQASDNIPAYLTWFYMDVVF